MAFQRHWEAQAFQAAGAVAAAPAQRGRLPGGRPSTALGSVQPYTPGILADRPGAPLTCDYVVAALREGATSLSTGSSWLSDGRRTR
ncbi:MAG: hypothetical protein IPG96_20430 [Proteobacteria bacterium]|nr:hypothetical protein [Pseudomonadota bacterium]